MGERLIVDGFNRFGGKHCETSALMKVLAFYGFPLPEEMLLGLGGGIGFIYWYMKQMPAPMVGGRYGSRDNFLAGICRRLGIEASVFETGSAQKGQSELKALLQEGQPAICYGDMAYLPHFAVPDTAHFGGHVFVVYGWDEEGDEVYLSDRGARSITISGEDLRRSRGSKYPPFPPAHRLLRIGKPARLGDLEPGIREALRSCCTGMLQPPIQNCGLAGISKWAKMVTQWPKLFKDAAYLGCLTNVFIFIETGGSGGSAFRPMFARFLDEASGLLNQPALVEAAEMFRESAAVWSAIATAGLPDDIPALRQTRELLLEKNRLFEGWTPEAQAKMQAINVAMEALVPEAVDSLSSHASRIAANMRDLILRLQGAEVQAFALLQNAIS